MNETLYNQLLSYVFVLKNSYQSHSTFDDDFHQGFCHSTLAAFNDICSILHIDVDIDGDSKLSDLILAWEWKSNG